MGVGLALVGLVLVLTVLRPARRTHVLTPSKDAEVWISRSALSRLAEQAVERVPGVVSVDAMTRRRLTVRVRAAGEDAEPLVRDAVEQAVGGFLAKPAKITVRKAMP
ncbi:DUF6286 domain-containing protein [Aeromicrobium sp. CF4.19]|uniref:DUF6286 domain-containing protein n=1 Tax=Aeromicrobium sp. CF4.19 TaxID=3373082 RepID=UPI003EE57A77